MAFALAVDKLAQDTWPAGRDPQSDTDAAREAFAEAVFCAIRDPPPAALTWDPAAVACGCSGCCIRPASCWPFDPEGLGGVLESSGLLGIDGCGDCIDGVRDLFCCCKGFACCKMRCCWPTYYFRRDVKHVMLPDNDAAFFARVHRNMVDAEQQLQRQSYNVWFWCWRCKSAAAADERRPATAASIELVLQSGADLEGRTASQGDLHQK
jgi:hypothetical protein